MKKILFVFFFITLFSTLLAAPVMASFKIEIQQIGKLPDSTATSGTSINNRGEVVGGAFFTSSANEKAFVWNKNDGMSSLPNPLGTGSSAAYGINNEGDIIGTINISPTATHSYLWTADGDVIYLGALNGATSVSATAINDYKQVVGYCAIAGTPSTTHAYLWTKGSGMIELEKLPGAVSSNAQAINNLGEIAGYCTFPGSPTTNHACLWTTSGEVTDLGTLSGATNSYGRGINNKGEVVGSSGTSGANNHAFLWTADNGMTDLGTLPGATISLAFSINERGQVVGFSGPAGKPHAFIWSAKDGMTALGEYPGDPTSLAIAINDRGQATGPSGIQSATGMNAVVWTTRG